MGRVFNREPAMILAVLGAGWQILSAFGFHFDPNVQSIVTAIVAAVLGVIVAVQVHDGLISAVNGLIVAGVSAVSYFAMHWDAAGQAKLVGAIMVVFTFFFVRQNVTPKVGPEVSPAGVLLAPRTAPPA